eukprot:TRINITY_DN18654_c0_g1_i1.p1 TRINITY_DN18654_c0_g1~~TRINITY_DN18654_c0_g1_i1.p1  ORF type:complete len:373 (+),score=48.20 TRINITY_DN18654_c0_g1_i1:1020-2138(+)
MEPNLVLHSSAMVALSRSQQAARSLTVFQCMQAAGMQLDTVAYDAAVGAAAARGWKRVCWLLEEFSATGMPTNMVLGGTSMSTLLASAQWRQAVERFCASCRAHLRPDGVLLGNLLTVCDKMQQWEKATNLFVQASGSGGEAAPVLVNICLSVLEHTLQWRKALQLYAMELAGRLEPNVLIRSTLIAACDKGLEWCRAISVLDGILAGGAPALEVVPYNAAVGSCEKASEWQQALGLFSGLGGLSLGHELATVVTYNVLLSSCTKGLQQDKALALLFQGVRTRLQLDIVSHNVVLAAGYDAEFCVARTPWLAAILDIWESLQARQMQPDATTYSCAIAAFEDSRQWCELSDYSQALQEQVVQGLSRTGVRPA